MILSDATCNMILFDDRCLDCESADAPTDEALYNQLLQHCVTPAGTAPAQSVVLHGCYVAAAGQEELPAAVLVAPWATTEAPGEAVGWMRGVAGAILWILLILEIVFPGF